MYLAETQPFHSLLCPHFAGAESLLPIRLDYIAST
ncbi:hypothetical protein LTSEBAI_0130, partial [Salmonella enterica subsp. enterica serovar Baildon str. R6-199]